MREEEGEEGGEEGGDEDEGEAAGAREPREEGARTRSSRGRRGIRR